MFLVSLHLSWFAQTSNIVQFVFATLQKVCVRVFALCYRACTNTYKYVLERCSYFHFAVEYVPKESYDITISLKTIGFTYQINVVY